MLLLLMKGGEAGGGGVRAQALRFAGGRGMGRRRVFGLGLGV